MQHQAVIPSKSDIEEHWVDDLAIWNKTVVDGATKKKESNVNKTVTPVGHKTLMLRDLAPELSPAFSPNLHKYLKAHGHFYRDGGTIEGVYKIRAGTKAAEVYGAGTLMLGFEDDGFFVGTRMISALCHGAKAERAAYPIGRSVELVEGFWDQYLNVGRCAIDPEHKEAFMGDRFSMDGDTRTCLWCGVKHERVLTPRTVFDESWKPV